MTTILFFDEQMTIAYTGLDQRKGKRCAPLAPTVLRIDSLDIRPRGANIIDLVQDEDSITITANGNGTGTVSVIAYLEASEDAVLSGSRQGCWETTALGSRSAINALAPAISEDILIMEPQKTVEIEQVIDDPDPDCVE
jgi:hypothetical protein